MKNLAVLALVGLATAKQVEPGKCPISPDEIPSKVRYTLDYSKLQGQWINYYDEKELAQQFTCMSAKFLQFNEQKKYELSF